MAQSLVHGDVSDAVRLENIIESEVMGSFDPLADNLQNLDDGNSDGNYKRSKRGGVAVSSDVVAGVIGASSGAASGAASAVKFVIQIDESKQIDETNTVQNKNR